MFISINFNTSYMITELRHKKHVLWFMQKQRHRENCISAQFVVCYLDRKISLVTMVTYYVAAHAGLYLALSEFP